jgi:hypothetical protein
MMMFVFVMFALVFSDQQCPHEHAHPLSFYPTPKTKFRYADDFPKLTVTPAHLSEYLLKQRELRTRIEKRIENENENEN